MVWVPKNSPKRHRRTVFHMEKRLQNIPLIQIITNYIEIQAQLSYVFSNQKGQYPPHKTCGLWSTPNKI